MANNIMVERETFESHGKEYYGEKSTCKSSTIFALSPMIARSIPKNLSASL